MSEGELIFIGLGLYDENDISLKGLNEIKNCDKIYAEFYTSELVGTNKNIIENKIGKKISILSRAETEKADTILESAEKEKVCFLVVGDPMVATTHIDLRLQAIEKKIQTKIIHGSSIITAVPGLLGLQNYKFGRTTTLAYPEKDYFPISPYQIIKENKDMGLHTLVLLDIQSDRNKYMTANEGIKLLLEMEKKQNKGIFVENSVVCVVARAGSDKPVIKADEASALLNEDFGPPLHSLVIPGNLHFMEAESLIKIAGLPDRISKKIQKL